MSKTFVIMDAPNDAKSIEEIGDENSYFLGAFGEVITAIKQEFPSADFSDPTHITANTESGKVLIEIAKHTPVQSFILQLEKTEAVDLVLKFCQRTKWRALDTDTGQFIDIKVKHNKDTSKASYKSWWTFWKKNNL